MASETLTPGSKQRVTILTALLRVGMHPKTLEPLFDLVSLEHVACCLCEPICLDENCDCVEDSHLDPDCYSLRDALRRVIERYFQTHMLRQTQKEGG